MTSNPHGQLESTRYQELIRAAAAGIQDLVSELDPATPTPTCPEWTVRRVVDHLGDVHTWAARVARGVRPPRDRYGLYGSRGADLSSWYADRVTGLLDTLTTLDPDQRCWSHQPGRQVVAYWSRRQAHEAAMHGVDLALAASRPPAYNAELAVDGIGEVLDVMLPLVRKRTGSTTPDLPAPVLIRCTDRPERWLISRTDPDTVHSAGPDLTVTAAAAAPAEIRGPAADLLLRMWRRGGTVEVSGDREVADRFLASTLTP